ncbi:class I SAM-dependent methyltransferase [Shinella oryzae]|uniref:Class I SAM-dependent methyltransferase n=1 Tax=Shinella oryzae TaxID=2871820 RepID=A0ABY9JYR0_9HYPH|nr:class I SAM-dependent methyltransferase [Shinella oryzae]WLS01465.1 class I SAM-dependent methyltransferase [Shinella oryzae]
MDTKQFAEVTEIAGQKISVEQLERMCNRYYWARQFIEGRDVVEAGCGAGQGLGYLALHARSVVAGDISEEVLERAKSTYGDTLELKVFDAASMPWPDGSFDAVLLFEAIYYLPDVDAFFREVNRVLRPGGYLLLVTANKDLYDFVQSPFSVAYYGVRELAELARLHGLSPEFWGFVDVDRISVRQRILRPLKSVASRLGLIPKTMGGKELLKKLFFGSLVDMPASILDVSIDYVEPTRLQADQADKKYKVIYCAARSSGSVSQAAR